MRNSTPISPGRCASYAIFAAIVFATNVSPAAVIATPLDQWGATADTAVAFSPSFSTSFNFGPFGGGILQSTATSSLTETRGSAQSSSSLTGPALLPVLKARGNANPGNFGGFAGTFASQGYTYSGPSATLTLSAMLDGVLDDPRPSSTADISASIVVFAVPNYFFTSSYGTLVFEAGATPLMQAVGGGEARIDFSLLNTGSINALASTNFNVNDGDQFYVWSVLGADAVSSNTLPGSADAFNTLTMSFASANGLTPASGPIPEPSGLALSSTSSALLAARRRRS